LIGKGFNEAGGNKLYNTFQAMGRCKPHLGRTNIQMATYMRAIVEEANKRGMLKVSLDRAFQAVKEITSRRNSQP
jgi:hypothetical protein